MTTPGYSGTPLLKKLGIKPDLRIKLLNAPGNYFELLGQDISRQICHGNEMPDLLHAFITSSDQLRTIIEKVNRLTQKNPGLIIWISWYKKSVGIPTAVTEEVIRKIAIQNDLVDIKVCAVSEIWSALKLVVPLSGRNAK